jgi:peptidylamidoglycolate lyase
VDTEGHSISCNGKLITKSVYLNFVLIWYFAGTINQDQLNGKNLSLSLVILAGIILLCYFLQPMKKGKGLDGTTRYERVTNWLHLPNDFTLGNPTGICMDTSQNLVVFHRAEREWPLIGPMPGKPIESKTILIIDRNTGQLLNAWGESLFIMPHGLKVDQQNNI